MNLKTRTCKLFLLPALVWALGCFAIGHGYAVSAKGEKAPVFRISTLDGNNLTLKSLVSPGKDRKKVVVLVFWATWCWPCCRETPYLNALHKKYSGKSVVVVGVAIDGDGAKPVREAVKKMGLKYTIGLDPDGARAADKYGADYIPSHRCSCWTPMASSGTLGGVTWPTWNTIWEL